MGELATLLSAVAALVTAIGGAVAIVVTAIRTSRRERKNTATDVVDELLAAAADGEITTAELEEIRKRMQGNDSGEAR
ncbi:hypothetical protein NLX83_39485 [Allokutzneria sp. A3M-2-11 16]|uniref:hypothetical protein n=1 Tax=Allokutzneria sp. A3M-2-11 16 TaxID=2962043 RepID=UPI0020B66D74|nr:hypothetical protein [Allokutzneria sp. A3M-2-11 16]MCP3805367.1 hypothetical protein [Allokutzneria sp. A3M-2-11 16]